ncbi:MAG: 4-alpha-glucanotransferase [Candidatus Aminicenantes bacterium]|nr:4-alpha-glucanotransferase [Candidatus Aminicenantes bacterium]
MNKRGSGVLLHISSLPSPYGVGDLGPGAYEFVDFLTASKQRYWQILPLTPTDPAFDHSPYHSYSAFAFNLLLISPDLLAEERLLDQRDLQDLPKFPRERVDYKSVRQLKRKIFHLAYECFKKKTDEEDFEKFCKENASWLDDYSLFVALKSRFRAKSWNEWPSEVRDREPEAIKTVRKELHEEIRKEKFLQHVFDKQWNRLKSYCNQNGILIFGDLPIYVVYDSVDLWTHPELFKLDSNRRPYVVAGVPPDYFSQTGQLWGNPLYRWDVLKQTRYDWWVKRMEHNLKLFDWVRMDHFRGFVGYWEVPAKESTAINGKWVRAPAMDFFNELKQRFRSLPIVAEDLGIITPDVKEVMEHFDFPGMKILLFAFGEDNPDHPYLPHTYKKNCLVYTGTHDNNTVRGWFKREAKPEDKKMLFRYIGRIVSEKEIHWEFIKLGAKSVANTFIVPMQDILGLGEEARMNKPATKRGNWCWRLLPEQVTVSLTEKLAEITETYGRT